MMSPAIPARLAGVLLLVACIVANAATATRPRQISTENKPWKGDFDAMLERRMVRVFVPYSRSLYFNDKGAERGLAVELVRDFEKYLNRKYARRLGKRPLTVLVIPVTRDKLLTALPAGLADIAVGNLTVTEERQKVVDFAGGRADKPVSEVLVTGPATPPIAGLDDLAGRTVHVRESSSYHQSLVALNQRLQARHRAPVHIALVPDALEDEDMMEMVAVGLLQAIVVDDWKARLWAQVLPKVRVREDIVLRSGGRIAWAIRKGNPRLAAEIEDFYAKEVSRQGLIAVRLASYMRRIRQLQDPTTTAQWKRFEETRRLFEKYGERYSFDPLMLAAQGYQESGLDQTKRSPSGAIGVMQLMPATGKSLAVGDITRVEPNVHGGAKYMDELMTKYFPGARFSETDRALFAFASYNCGASNVQKARTEAAARGLDPDQWFNNVEIVIAERVGIQTTTYVRNIYKYYIAYKLIAEAAETARKAREQLVPGSQRFQRP
jgi:membrane-bound lytic murein transglycosylase MltF